MDAGLLTNLLAVEWFDARDDFLVVLVRVLILVGLILAIVPGLIWWERRLLSWMQDRIGPNRVGPMGLLQPIADGVKLFFKEDITPTAVDRVLYFVAPAIALFPAFVLGGTMPWGPIATPFAEPYSGVYSLLTPVADVNIGVLYLFAISALGVYGVVIAGYASNNKYSLMGGLRASAQLISYELAMGISLAVIVLATGSLKMTDMVRAQEQGIWGFDGAWLQNWFLFTPYGFIAAVIFLICMVAETNRAPFDLPEAENELIAGYHTEYSSMKFAVFFMGEYAAMLVFSGIFAAVFMGGYNAVPVRWDFLAVQYPGMSGLFSTLAWINYWGAPVFFLAKMALGISVYVWLRATLPRLRYDQLMDLGWKSLLPLAAMTFIGVATYLYIDALFGNWAAIATIIAVVAIALIGYSLATRGARKRAFMTRKAKLVETETRRIELVDPSSATP